VVLNPEEFRVVAEEVRAYSAREPVAELLLRRGRTCTSSSCSSLCCGGGCRGGWKGGSGGRGLCIFGLLGLVGVVVVVVVEVVVVVVVLEGTCWVFLNWSWARSCFWWSWCICCSLTDMEGEHPANSPRGEMREFLRDRVLYGPLWYIPDLGL